MSGKKSILVKKNFDINTMSAIICLFRTEQPIMLARHLDLCTQFSDQFII